ncbi:MAG TPA: hypothetical protein VID94_13120 [Acidimicrobiales bacterium]
MFAALTAVAEERDRYLYALEQARWDIRLLYATVALSPETDLGLRHLYADLDAVLSEKPGDLTPSEKQGDPAPSEKPGDPAPSEKPGDPALWEMPNDPALWEMPNDAVLWEMPNDDAIPLPPVPAGLSKEE